jgi:hypothetical protein
MSPKEAWNIYTAGLPSPQSYLDIGFYSLISSALERRVWYYDTNRLFVNLFVILVGRPALGKGLVLTTNAKILKSLKATDKQRAYIKTPGGGKEPANRFAVGADCATFQQILIEMAESRMGMMVPDPKNPDKMKPDSHMSLAFILEELSSLFRRHQDEVVKFLLRAYDANEYEYKTKHDAPVILRQLCMNLLAGTQMGFLQEAHQYGIFDQGFSSRVIWVFETDRRFTKFHIEGSDQELKAQAEKVLLEHIEHLSHLYGKLTYSQEVYEFLEHWYINDNAEKEVTSGPRMEGYYGRKKVHVLKIAAAIHFSYSYDMEISLEDVKQALAFLNELEPRMSAGLNVIGRNKLAPYGREIMSMIEAAKDKGLDFRVIVSAMSSSLTVTETETALEELMLLTRVNKRVSEDKKSWVYFEV